MASLAPAEIRALASMVDELDYYQLLEIPRDASASDVRRAYHSTCRRYHPDANRHLGNDLRDALENIARRLSEAYCVVRDPRRRSAYDKRLLGDSGGLRIRLAEATANAEQSALEERAGSTPKGRRFYMQYQNDLQRGDLAAAARNLQMALTFEPGNKLFKEKLEEVREKLQG